MDRGTPDYWGEYSFCGCDDRVAAAGAEPVRMIPPSCRDPYYVWVDWSGYTDLYLTKQIAQRCFSNAMAAWNNAIDIRFVLHASPEYAHSKVSWVAPDKLSRDPIRRPVWATANKADGSCTKNKTMAFNNEAAWTEVLLTAGCIHELGHVLGLPHLSGVSVMSAGLGTLTTPQTVDLEEAVKHGYALRRPLPKPPQRPTAEEWHVALLGVVELIKREIA